MAEFCTQCAKETFGDDARSDFYLPEDQKGTLQEGEGWGFLCEGCGPTLVNDNGDCISEFCLCQHGKDSE